MRDSHERRGARVPLRHCGTWQSELVATDLAKGTKEAAPLRKRLRDARLVDWIISSECRLSCPDEWRLNRRVSLFRRRRCAMRLSVCDGRVRVFWVLLCLHGANIRLLLVVGACTVVTVLGKLATASLRLSERWCNRVPTFKNEIRFECPLVNVG